MGYRVCVRSSVSLIFCVVFQRDIMIGTHHTPESSGVSDEEICRLIHEEVGAAIRAEIPEMFGSIKTTLIESFDERYAALTDVVVAVATTSVAAARPQGG